MFDIDPDAEWVRLEESWTAAAINPWQIDIAEDEPPRSGWVIVWVLGAIVAAALVALAVWWTR